MRVVKEILNNVNKNNVNGIFCIEKLKIFYKILKKTDFQKEIEGYNILSKFYKVPKRYFIIDDENKKIIGYEYNNNIQKNQGLLVDYFYENINLDSKYYEIIEHYYNVFNKTIIYNKYDNCRIFFDDRINTRLKNNLEAVYKIKTQKTYFINDNEVNINIEKIERDLIEFFSNSKNTWNIISQCDPNDLNICIDGMLFDYTGGGFVPIMAEFATFFWYNLAQSEYLALKYNKKAFKYHKNIYKKINLVKIKYNNVKHVYRKIRLDAILYYIENIVKPILKNIDYHDWYEDFKKFLSMKILTVFDFNSMSKKDIMFSIICLQMIYDNEFKNIDEFIEFIKKYGGKDDRVR